MRLAASVPHVKAVWFRTLSCELSLNVRQQEDQFRRDTEALRPHAHGVEGKSSQSAQPRLMLAQQQNTVEARLPVSSRHVTKHSLPQCPMLAALDCTEQGPSLVLLSTVNVRSSRSTQFITHAPFHTTALVPSLCH